jgi:hypothetical protein
MKGRAVATGKRTSGTASPTMVRRLIRGQRERGASPPSGVTTRAYRPQTLGLLFDGKFQELGDSYAPKRRSLRWISYSWTMAAA